MQREELLNFIDRALQNSNKDSLCYIKKNKKFTPHYECLISNTPLWAVNRPFREIIYIFKNNIVNEPTCIYCKKPSLYFVNKTKGYCKFCSKDCADKFYTGKLGVERALKANNTKRNTIIDGKNMFQITGHKSYKTQIKNNSHLNCTRAAQKWIKNNKELFSERIKHTLRQKDSQGLTPAKRARLKRDAIEKAKTYTKYLELMKKDNLLPLFTQNEYIENLKTQKYVNLKCLKCGFISRVYLAYYRCIKCKPFKESKPELEIINFLKDYNPAHRVRIYNRLEVDILLSEKNLGIEFNGLMYHSYGIHRSEKFNNYDKININRQLRKTDLCEQQNIKLFQIFETEWSDPVKKDIWKSVLLNALQDKSIKKINGRDCTVKSISSRESIDFCELHHLQGGLKSPINLGLFYQEELVSVMTFSKPRFSTHSYELLRFCNKKYCKVMGGASKLLSFFERMYSPISLVTYANRRYSRGELYKKLGFTKTKINQPNYFYFQPNKNILYSRVKFQKHKLKSLLANFDANKTEIENMLNNKYRIIYDCGNITFVKTYENRA